METFQPTQKALPPLSPPPLISSPILQQQSLNIQRPTSFPSKEQENCIENTDIRKTISENTTISLNEPQPPERYKHMHKNSIISNAIAEIDDFERDDLLLSSSTIRTEDLINEHQTMCRLHGKVEDIICMVEKTKICCYCALFGLHKDHTFKSENQLIEEIESVEAKIRETDKRYKNVLTQFISEKNLKLVKEYCEAKRQQSISQLEQQVNNIIQKIQRTKEDIKVKTMSQFDFLTKKIEQAWQSTTKNITKSAQYDQWKQNALTILNSFSQKIQGCDFIESFKEYQRFQWEKGAIIVDKYNEALRNFTKRSQESLDDLRFNHSYSLKNILASTLQFDSQKTIQLHLQTPPTSLQQLHKQLSFSYKSDQNYSRNELFQSKQKIRIRHSQMLQSTLQPIQEQHGKHTRNIRCSFNSGSKKMMKNDSSFLANNHSILLTRQKSNPRLQQTLKSPKSRASIYKSPSHYKTNRNPLQILAHFQRNKNQTSLNFSNCGLKSDQLLYFVEKAFNSHIPIDLNLQKNKLSISGLVKLLPFLSKVVSVNLSKTQLDENCLQILSKIKAVRRLYEINLSQNDISQLKNQLKLQHLRNMGFKIII